MSTPEDPISNKDTPLSGSEVDTEATPDMPAVIDVGRVSLYPGSRTTRTSRLAAIAVIVGATVATVMDKAVKTPRAPQVMNGGPGDGGAGGTGGTGGSNTAASCNISPADMYPDPQQIFGVDNVHVKNGTPDTEFPCEFETEGSSETVIGTEFVDGKKIRHCFFSRVWAEGAAMRLAGTIKVDKKIPGQIKLVDGLLDVVVGVDTNENKILDEEELAEKKVLIDGPASLAITTTDRVSITRMPPVNGVDNHEVLVVAVKGQTLIYQQGREEAIILNECQELRVPLDIKEASQGCYIAEDMGRGGSRNQSGAVMLAAGAVFLAVRRRSKKA